MSDSLGANLIMSIRKNKPKGYEDSLSDYKTCIFDGYCGEPIMWGFEITKMLSETMFSNLKQYGDLECVSGYTPKWFLITKKLTREEAEKLYGPRGNDEFGPRGGWKSVMFGDKKFISSQFKVQKK